VSRQQPWCNRGQQWRKVRIELDELSRKSCPALGKQFQRDPSCRQWIAWSARTPTSCPRHQRLCAQRTRWLAQFLRGGVQYSSQLIGGLGARLNCRTAGDAQHADRLDQAVTVLASQHLTSEHGPGGRLGTRISTVHSTCRPSLPAWFEPDWFGNPRQPQRLNPSFASC
jgi:hypothetical protein